MSLAYPIHVVNVETVFGLDSVSRGSVWKTGNLLFRASAPATNPPFELKRWARSVDAGGRVYIIWEARHARAGLLVIQPVGSRYCYELRPA